MITKDSIAIRLKLIYLGLVSIVLLGQSALYYIIISNNQKQNLESEISSLANLVALNLIAPLSFDDKIAASDALSSLKTEPNIVAARIFDINNNTYVEYHPTSEDKDALKKDQSSITQIQKKFWDSETTRFFYTDQYFHYLMPITFDEELIGRIYLQIDLSYHKSQKRQTLLISTLAFLTAIILVFISFAYVRRWVIEPIQMLSNLMAKVTRSQDYSLRLKYESRDQVGKLINGFNQMLEEIKVRDDKLQNWAEQLENKVAIRTKELSDSNAALEKTIDALQKAQDKIVEKERSKLDAEAKERAKSGFLANMSHELRTPMNGVMGMMSLLKETGLNYQQNDYLAIAMESAQHLLSLLDDVLDYSKVESGKIDYEHVPFSAINIVDASIQILNQQAISKSVALRLFIINKVPRITLGDPLRYKQIIINLISNAIKFTEKGEVSVTIKALPIINNQTKLINESEVNNRILLEVKIKDTGIGIPKNKLGSIFESFQQADTSTTRLYGGTGLGLALCKLMIDDMGGEIDVESTLNEGSCFTVRLPLETKMSSGHTSPPLNHEDKIYASVFSFDRLERLSLARRLKYMNIRASIAHNFAKLEHIIQHKKNLSFVFVDYEIIDNHFEDFYNTFKHTRKTLTWIPFGDYEQQDNWQNKNQKYFLVKPINQVSVEKLLSTLIANPTPSLTHINNPSNSNLSDLKASRFKIMIVDDNTVNRMVAQGHLKQIGVTTECCENGAECIDLLEKEHFDLILMDCQMPVMDGYEATLNIRKHKLPRISEVIIVAMTSNAFEEDRIKCINAGMDDYMAKPVESKKLIETLCLWLIEKKSA